MIAFPGSAMSKFSKAHKANFMDDEIIVYIFYNPLIQKGHDNLSYLPIITFIYRSTYLLLPKFVTIKIHHFNIISHLPEV